MLVLLLSKNAILSPHVLREVERASSKTAPVLTVRLDDAAIPAHLEYFLRANQWLDASGGGVSCLFVALGAVVAIAAGYLLLQHFRPNSRVPAIPGATAETADAVAAAPPAAARTAVAQGPPT
jgi:hypothetical protein